MSANNKPVLDPSTWCYLYSEIADYILEYSSLDPIWETDSEGNEVAVRTEEKQDEFMDIADTVESIMQKVLTKGEY